MPKRPSSDLTSMTNSTHSAPGAVLGPDVTEWSNAWLEIDPAVFEKNIESLREHIGPQVAICATMKADAYHHGIALLMPSIIRMGVPGVGVSSNAEALQVRHSGYRGRIMRLRPASLPEMIKAFEFGVEEILGNLHLAESLSGAACQQGVRVRFHLVINSGQMGRIDIDMGTEQGRTHALNILKLTKIKPVGIMTHFALENPEELRLQAYEFQKDAEWLLANSGLQRDEIILHAANSNALLDVRETHFDMVRPGRVLYGYSNNPKFVRFMTFKTRVTTINEYSINTRIGYNHTCTLQRDSRLANIPVGYADSHRKAYTGGDVLIRGHRVPIVGAITMNSFMVDVTDFPDVKANDEVVLYGDQEGESITGAEIQKYINESMAEMTTRWSVNPKVRASKFSRVNVV